MGVCEPRAERRIRKDKDLLLLRRGSDRPERAWYVERDERGTVVPIEERRVGGGGGGEAVKQAELFYMKVAE